MKILKSSLLIVIPFSIMSSEQPKSSISLSDRMEFQRIIKKGNLNHFVNKLYSQDERIFAIDDDIIEIASEHAKNLQLRDEALRSKEQELAIILAISFENMLRCEKAAQAHKEYRIIEQLTLSRQENQGFHSKNKEHECSSLEP